MSSSVASGIVTFSAFGRGHASHACYLRVVRVVAQSLPRRRARLWFFWPHTSLTAGVRDAGAVLELRAVPYDG